MTSKCKTCGHEKEKHYIGGCTAKGRGMKYLNCPCEKFSPEDETCEYCDRKTNSPNFAYHVCTGRKKQKKGCGKMYNHFLEEPVVSTCGVTEKHLCPSCQSQSSLYGNIMDTPEVEVGHHSSGIQSPQDEFKQLEKSGSEDTFNLSDKIDKWFEDYNDMGEEWQIPTEEFNKLKSHIKEFISRLKEDIENSDYVKGFANMIVEELFPIIDKLAGEKLT